jgi:protein SCO1/2
MWLRKACILMLLALLAACEGSKLPSPFHASDVTAKFAQAGFQLTDHNGKPRTLADFRGKVVVIFFGYIHCPDVCPTTLADWKRAKQKVGADAAKVRFVFVTVDPERDTPQIADAYATQFDPSFVGVSGDAATTAAIMASFGVTAAKETGTAASNYLVSHSAQAFLVDDRGRVIAMYPFGIGWDALAADLESIL